MDKGKQSCFRLRIYAEEGIFYEGDCVSLVFPAQDGSYGVLPHHSNLIAALMPGGISYRDADGKEMRAAVSYGLVKVENNDVLILTESAVLPEDIDIDAERREAAESMEELRNKQSIREYKLTQARLTRSLGRLKVKTNDMKEH